MKWSEVEIIDNNDKKLRGGAAKRFVEKNCPDAPIKTIIKESILVHPNTPQKSASIKDVRTVLFLCLFGKAKSLRILKGTQSQKKQIPLARAVPNVQNVNPSLLHMYLDVNRDGNVDDGPANNSDWTWGVNGHGAIVVVKTKNYADNTAVNERIPIEFRWDQGRPRPVNWQATLSANHPDRIRIYRQQTEGAALINLPCDIHNLGQEDAQGIYRLWIEAFDFPETVAENDWLIQLNFSLQFNGGVRNQQTSVIRIAPWIMASDIDITHRVFLRTTAGIANPLPDAIAQWVGGGNCERFEVAANQPKKGFARDIMKSGYVAAPHFSGILIQERMDQSPLQDISAVAAANINGGFFIKPNGHQANRLTGQDNGGNLMITPPNPPDYPWGRILFGGDDDDHKCNSEDFYRAQKLQHPIRLDSTWLRVGHVDEMLSFVRCQDGTYRALLISPRLAYIMLRGVASRNDANAGDLIDWAVGINNQCIGEGIYSQNGLTGKLNNLNNVNVPNPAINYVEVPNFVANPVVPNNSDRFVISRVDGTEFAVFMDGRPLVGQRMQAYNAAFPEGRDSFELQVHSSRFLDRANNVLLGILNYVQPILDRTRQMLRDDLGFTDNQIIDVPVLLNVEAGKCVALTGDSVNLLQLAGNPASRCLVPKPFGPVFVGEYVFERYLTTQFAAMQVQAQFLADDKFHVMEGEIHCGTNQTHPPLPNNNKAWWEMNNI